MSKLARALALVAMLAALLLAGMTVAHAYPVDPTTRRPVATPQQQPSGDDALRRRLAEEHYYGTWREENPAIQQARAQERYYSSWRYRDTSAPAAAEPGGQPGWRTPALGVLAAVLALVAGVAVLAARRASRRPRAAKPA